MRCIVTTYIVYVIKNCFVEIVYSDVLKRKMNAFKVRMF